MLPLLLPQAGLAGIGTQRLLFQDKNLYIKLPDTARIQAESQRFREQNLGPLLIYIPGGSGQRRRLTCLSLNLLIFPGRSDLWPTLQINWEDEIWSSLAKGFVWCEGIDKCEYIKGGYTIQMRPQDFTSGWWNHFQAEAISKTELWEPSSRMPAAGVE